MLLVVYTLNNVNGFEVSKPASPWQNFLCVSRSVLNIMWDKKKVKASRKLYPSANQAFSILLTFKCSDLFTCVSS